MKERAGSRGVGRDAPKGGRLRDVSSNWNPARIRVLSARLAREYENPRHHNKDDPLDELIFILLSGKTGERAYLRTFEALKSAFPKWNDLLKAPPSKVRKMIEFGGLARKKEEWIRRVLETMSDGNRGVDLSFLSTMSNEEAEGFLTSLPGVGLKSARCVLMYSLGRKVFPVDSHCNRILSRLGLINNRRLSKAVQDEIQALIPEELRYSLHVNLVAHGRSKCTASNPRCSACVIIDICHHHLATSQ